MKKLITIISFITGVMSCNKTNLQLNQNYSLIGTWKVDSIVYKYDPVYIPELDTLDNRSGSQMLIKIREQEIQFIHQDHSDQGVYGYIYTDSILKLYGNGSFTNVLFIEKNENKILFKRINDKEIISTLYTRKI